MNRLLILWLLSCLVTMPAMAEDLPIIQSAKAGDATVNGQGLPGLVPIVIYDLSYPARTALGSSTSMDKIGNFAVGVTPRLLQGHKLIAVDGKGNTSGVTIVQANTDSPAGPGR